MLIIIPVELTQYTNNQAELSIKAATPRTALTRLLNDNPCLYLHLLGPEGMAHRYACVLDDEWLLDASNVSDVFDTLELVEIPSGADFGISAGIAAIASAIATSAGYSFAVYYAAYAIITVAVGMALSAGLSMLSGMIMGSPSTGGAGVGSVGSSSAYSFNGVQNTTAPGTVVPVVYGTHRVGGQLLSISTSSSVAQDVTGTVTQYYDNLRAVIALSEGPIKSVDKLLIGGYPTTYYDGWLDATNPYAYSLGHSEVSAAIQPHTVINSGGHKTLVKPVLWNASDSNGVIGDLSQFTVIENTNTNINNFEVLSISPFVTYGDNNVTWIDDLDIPLIPLYGVWVENIYYPDANSLTGVPDGTYSFYPGGTVILPSSFALTNPDGTIITVSPSIEAINTIVYSKVTRDKVVIYGGRVYYQRQVASLGSLLNFVSPNTLNSVLGGSGITKVVTNTAVTGFRIGLTFPLGLYKVNTSNGNYDAVTVPIGVFFRPQTVNNSTLWVTLHLESVAGNLSGEVLKEVASYTLPEDTYEIAIVRFTDKSTDHYTKDQLKVKSLTEVITAGLGYPYTAIMGMSLRATDQLAGSVPAVTCLVEGRIIQVPDKSNGWPTVGGLLPMRDAVNADEMANPIWCLLDLLTNTRYGLGNYYPITPSKINIMLLNFDYAASYCDQTLSYVDGLGTVKTRKRFALNMVMDTSKAAADWVETIKAVARANVYYSHGLFWVDIDRPKIISQLFNMSNLTGYNQSGTSWRAAPNVLEVQFPNPNIDYAMDVFRVESPAYRADSSIEENKKDLSMIGVTNQDQAKAVAKYTFYKSLLTKQITFKTGTEALRCQVNDVFGVSHDVPKWGAGGRVVSVSNLNNNYTCITDIPIIPNSITGNKIYIQDYSGVVRTITIVSATPSGFTYDFSVNGNFVPNNSGTHLDAFSYGISLFKAVSIQKDSDLLSTITATEYSNALFDACDDTSDMSAFATKNYSQIPIPFKSSVNGVTVVITPTLYNNMLIPIALVSWEPPASPGFVSVDLYITSTTVTNYTCIASDITNRNYSYTPSIPDGEYQIVVTVNYTGRKQTLADAVKDKSVTNSAIVTLTTLDPSISFQGGVTGLAIENQANDNTFVGKDCSITWRRPLVVDLDIPADGETYGASSTPNNLLSYYSVEVTDVESIGGILTNIPKSIRRKSKVFDEKYTYTHEFNSADQITRNFAISVTATDILGRSSQPKTIICSNPAPLAFT